MIRIYQTVANTFDYYEFWNDRIIEERFEITGGYITVLGSYAAEEGRNEKVDTCISYKKQQLKLLKMITFCRVHSPTNSLFF